MNRSFGNEFDTVIVIAGEESSKNFCASSLELHLFASCKSGNETGNIYLRLVDVEIISKHLKQTSLA